MEYQQIAYFPYVFMGSDPIAYEGVTMWNFSREAERRIPDANTRVVGSDENGANLGGGGSVVRQSPATILL
ncbi:MAG: hypothetical protein A2036_00905 [Omnitrophica bacterium GWA2_50_21]|nr:MAG: hypothetical protein A2036_00905 [Omnitrophica bacterium GWA2_50_21]